MASRRLSVIVLAALVASCINAQEFVIPIPEVTVTIGGAVSSIPVQYEDLVIPIIFDPVPTTSYSPQTYFQPSFQPDFDSYQSFFPAPPPPLIILDNGNNNDLSLLYLLLLLGNFNGGNGNNCGGGCYNNGGYYCR